MIELDNLAQGRYFILTTTKNAQSETLQALQTLQALLSLYNEPYEVIYIETDSVLFSQVMSVIRKSMDEDTLPCVFYGRTAIGGYRSLKVHFLKANRMDIGFG